jgi:hypothetical protein
VSALQKPPAGLQGHGSALWKAVIADVHEEWQLDAKDLHTLELAARAADRAEELQALIDRDGLTVPAAPCQEKLNPAISEQRMQRQLSALLVTRIALAPPEAKTGHLNGRQRQKLRSVGR